jgi:hypothetical protein
MAPLRASLKHYPAAMARIDNAGRNLSALPLQTKKVAKKMAA